MYARQPEVASLALGEEEPVRLREFVDKSVVEVLVNGRHFLALIRLNAWQMSSIW